MALEIEIAWLTRAGGPGEFQRLVISSEFDSKVGLHAVIINEPLVTTRRSESAQKIHDLAFGPTAIVAIGLGKKRAVAAIVGFMKGDVRVSGDPRSRF